MTVAQVGSVLGLVLLLAVFYDLFQSVILPRPAVNKVTAARIVLRPMWRLWRWVSQRSSRIDRSEGRLAAFAPIALLMLFFIWAAAAVVGYGLIIDGLADQFRPSPQDLATSIYISATTLVPLSYGDFVPEGGLARAVIIAESATGVGIAALVITLLFSLYESFRDREVMVVSLDALAGAPPSGVQILENAAKHGMRPELVETFDDWRGWAAMVLESHLAYPLLIYFRSSHDNEAWINSFGAVMDAAVLIISTVDDDSVGPAYLMLRVGNHLVEDFSWIFGLKGPEDGIVEHAEYQVAVERLMKAGYQVRDTEKGWKQFAELRSKYASPLNQMAHWLVELRVHAELAAEAADVGADGRVADSKPQGDAAARQPFRHQPQHLLLARGQAPELGIDRLALGEQRRDGARRDQYPAASDLANRRHNLSGSLRFVDECACPGLDRGKTGLVAVLTREEDHLRVGPDSADGRGGLRAGAIGQAEIQQHDVGLQLGCSRCTFGYRARLADDLHIRLVVDQGGQTLRDDPVVLDDEDANRVFAGRTSALPVRPARRRKDGRAFTGRREIDPWPHYG